MSHGPEPQGVSDEQARLDRAIEGADDLLKASLRAEERRRRRRRSAWITLTVGGTVMTGLVIVVALLGAPEVSAEDKERAAARMQEGWALWQQRKFDAAEQAFAASVELDPTNADAWNGLGWSRFNGGKPEKAVEAFEESVELVPTHPAALNGLGQIALMQRRYDDAEKWLLKAAPNAPAAWYGLARLYLLQGRFEEAEKYAEQAAAQPGSDPTAKQMLAAAKTRKLDPALRKQIEPPPAQAARRGAPSGKLKAFSAESREGWALFQQGNAAGAAEKFRAALKKNPQELAAHNGLGFVLINQGNAEEAREHFEFYLEHEPDAAGPLNGLARVQMAQGQVDEAIATWEKMDKLPGIPEVHAGTYGLAEAYAAKGEHAKALAQYEKIAKAEPGNAQVQSKLAELRGKVSKP